MRRRAGLTVPQLAEKMGCTCSAIYFWEAGRYWPKAECLPRIAEILGCSIDAIAGYDPPVSYSDPAQAALNGYWESMNDDGRERLLGIAELAADSGKVRVQKNAGDLRVPSEMGRSA